MKLRQLMTNSLQRTKNKNKDSKKKGEEEDRKKKPEKEVQKGGLFSSRRTRKESSQSEPVTNNREVSQSRRTKSDSDCGRTKTKAKHHDYATINYEKSYDIRNRLDSNDYYYIGDKLTRYRDPDIINVNFNINASNPKCACYKHIDASLGSYKHLDAHKGYYNPDATELYPTGELQNSFLAVVDNNCNSLPKTRTRIKTNPWLPSPRSTPTSSMTSSMASSITSSPDGDFPGEGKSFEPADDEFEYFNMIGRSTPLNTLSRTPEPMREQRPRSEISHLQYNVLQRSFTSDTDNENCSFQPTHGQIIPLGGQQQQHPLHHSSSVEQLSAVAKETWPEPNFYTFNYEEAFESQIESAKVGRVYGSRDLLDDYGSRDTLFDDVSSSVCGVPSRRWELSDKRGHRKRKPFLILRYSRRFEEQESTEETDDTLKGEDRSRPRRPPERLRRRVRNPKTRKAVTMTTTTTTDDSADDGVETGSEGDYVPEDHELDDLCAPRDLFDSDNDLYEPVSDLCDPSDPGDPEKSERTTLNESVDSAIEIATCSSDSAGDRSLNEVRSSLQEKVSRLRQEKLVVDEKIRQAQEEERLRVQERMKLQKQLTLERKQILLRTLRDLKVKLETQSERLQSTYNNVLYMQKQFIRHKRHDVTKLGVAVESANMKEAPF